MTVKSSTGLRNHLMGTGSFKSGMSGGSIRIFAGPAPADADAAETGTLLCVVTNNGTGTGLTFAAAAANGVLPKARPAPPRCVSKAPSAPSAQT